MLDCLLEKGEEKKGSEHATLPVSTCFTQKRSNVKDAYSAAALSELVNIPLTRL